MILKNSLLVLLLLVAQAQAETRYTYYHNDVFGSPVAMTDQAGNVIARKDYTPYGEASGNDGANHIGFTGHAEDQLTHLTYMQQRMQDPRTGRFLSIDPASVNPEEPMTFNRYAYANNNPYRFVDPDGRDAVDDKILTLNVLSGMAQAFKDANVNTPNSVETGGVIKDGENIRAPNGTQTSINLQSTMPDGTKPDADYHVHPDSENNKVRINPGILIGNSENPSGSDTKIASKDRRHYVITPKSEIKRYDEKGTRENLGTI